MESYTSLFIAFLCGIVAHSIWNYLVNIGSTIVMLKRTIVDCVLILAKNIQSVHELNHLKQEAWNLIGRDEKYIEFQKRADRITMSSLQNTAIRNFINSIPPKYSHLIKFHDWDSAMKYIDTVIKEEK